MQRECRGRGWDTLLRRGSFTRGAKGRDAKNESSVPGQDGKRMEIVFWSVSKLFGGKKRKVSQSPCDCLSDRIRRSRYFVRFFLFFARRKSGRGGSREMQNASRRRLFFHTFVLRAFQARRRLYRETMLSNRFWENKLKGRRREISF